ncbi:MAG: RidA family protein [Sandaracinaceae bacterium]|nr:RidA family protein [Sandaracinaceae bacterium]
MGAGRVSFGGELAPAPPRHRVQTAAPWESKVGYARAVRVGDLVWVTGTTAFDAAGAPVGIGDAHAQAVQCLANVERALVALGSSRAGVVRTRMFVTDIARDWEAIGRAHAEVFGEVRPATTMVEVRRLIADWMLVEIEADAVL